MKSMCMISSLKFKLCAHYTYSLFTRKRKTKCNSELSNKIKITTQEMTENSAGALLKEKSLQAEASQNNIATCTVQRPDPSKIYDSSWLKGTAADPYVPQRNCTNKSAPSLKADFSHPVYKKLSRMNGKINSMHVGELIDNLKCLNLETR